MRRRLVWALPLAALFAVAGFLVAPDPWPEGDGEVLVSLTDDEGEALDLEVPVVFGDTEPVEVIAEDVMVALVSGVPTDAPVDVEVTVEGRSTDSTELTVDLVLPNGEDEAVPVVSATSDGGTSVYEATRRPPVDAGVVLGLLGFVLVLWITEAVPLVVTSLTIPVVLVFTGTTTAAQATEPFADPIIVLFFAGFLMAVAMQRAQLDSLVASSITSRAGRGPVTLFATLVATAATASMWMSNTAAMTLLIPIALAVTHPLESRSYRKVVVLGMAYAATIGGVGSAIGTPANQLAIKYLDDMTDTTITFAEWFAFGLPMVILFLPVMGLYLWRFAGDRPSADRFDAARRVALARRAEAGRLTFPQIEVVVVFAAVLVGWLSQGWHGWSPGIVALAGAVVLMGLGRISPDDVGRISWPTLLTFGGGLALGEAMVASGVADWIVSRLDVLGSWPSFWALLAVALISLGMTTVASNTAAAATLIPLAVPLAGLIGLDPVVLVMVVAIATSIDFALVIGTPPTMLAYSTRLFSAAEIFRRGAVLDLAAVLVLVTLVVASWHLMGLV